MGSSTRKKKEKKKDFQKPKLKVGKAKVKPTNFTDTSFRSKAIVLHQQLTEDAPDAVEKFKHNLSLATSRSDTQRRDALSYLTGQLSSTPPNNPAGTPTLLNKFMPLMSDASGPVRGQLLKLLRTIPEDEVKPYIEKMMLYVRGAMTHISQDIKDDGLNYLEWLLEVAGDELVAGAGCWVKPLEDLAAILGWSITKPVTSARGQGCWTSAPRTTFGAKNHGHSYPRQMLVLAKFLEYGFKPETMVAWEARQWFENLTRLPTGPNPYGSLNLFGQERDEAGEMYPNREDRQAIFHKKFLVAMLDGVKMAKQEGGLAGRAAATLHKALQEGMADYEPPLVDYDDESIWDGYVF